MANLVLDFLRGYSTGQRRESVPSAYQWDQGHVLEVQVPGTVTSCEIQYWKPGMQEALTYTPQAIDTSTTGQSKIIGNFPGEPNDLFKTSSELRIYIAITEPGGSITRYEGYVTIRPRAKPDDYVESDPVNPAVSYIEQAHAYAKNSEAYAKGTMDGAAVESGQDGYQDSSLYYKTLAREAADEASGYKDTASQKADAAAASASAAAAIVTVANNGMVVVDEDDGGKKYAVTFSTHSDHLIAVMTPASQ